MGEFNTKYIISPYPLTDDNLTLKSTADGFFIYQNRSFLPRAYFKINNDKNSINAPILVYSPNHIRVDTTTHISDQLILAEVYNTGWKAYLNGKIKVPVQETPSSLRLVDLEPKTDFVDFRYKPVSFRIGMVITSLTILFIGIILVKKYCFNSGKNHYNQKSRSTDK